MSGSNARHVVLPNGMALDMSNLGKVNLRGQRPSTVETTEVKPDVVSALPTDSAPPPQIFIPAPTTSVGEPTKVDKQRAKSTLVEAAAAAKVRAATEAKATPANPRPSLSVIEKVIGRYMDEQIIVREHMALTRPDVPLRPWNQVVADELVKLADEHEADPATGNDPLEIKTALVLRFVAQKLWSDPDYRLTQREMNAVLDAHEAKPVWFGKAKEVSGVTVGQKVEMTMGDFWILVVASFAVWMVIGSYFEALDNLRQSDNWFTWAWSNVAMGVTMLFGVPAVIFLFWSPIIWIQLKLRDKRREYEANTGYETSNGSYAFGVIWRVVRTIGIILFWVFFGLFWLLFFLMMGSKSSK